MVLYLENELQKLLSVVLEDKHRLGFVGNLRKFYLPN